MPTDQENSIANGDHLRKKIVIVGTGPVALFIAYCLNQSSMNDVVVLGRPNSNTTQNLIDSGRLMLNTKTIRDLYSMLHESYVETDFDRDLSIAKEGVDEKRAIQVGRALVSKFEKMGSFGVLAAEAIKAKGEGTLLTKQDLNDFTKDHFETPIAPLREGTLSQGFDGSRSEAKPVYVTTDSSIIGQNADLVITALKAHAINDVLAEQIKTFIKAEAPVLVAANGINTTLIPNGNERKYRPLREALFDIPALKESAKFSRALEGEGHDVLGASITFALQMANDMPVSETNPNPKAGDMRFASLVHEAFLTIPRNKIIQSIFGGARLIIDAKTDVDYAKSVLTKLAINQMNIMCAGLSKDKQSIITDLRFRAVYADAVGEIFDVAAEYGINLSDSRSVFVKHCMEYHDSSVGQGGHKSSTVVDIEKGRKTEAAFLIEAIEELADELKDELPEELNIHVLRVLRRSLRAVEETAINDTPEQGKKRGKILARNIVLLPDGTTTQYRVTQGKAENKGEINPNHTPIEEDLNKPAGTYITEIPAWSYRNGMHPKAAEFLLEERIKIKPQDQVFLRTLLEQYYDADNNTHFAPEFEPLENVLIKSFGRIQAADLIDDFIGNKSVRMPTLFDGAANTSGGSQLRFNRRKDGAETSIEVAGANDNGCEEEDAFSLDYNLGPRLI